MNAAKYCGEAKASEGKQSNRKQMFSAYYDQLPTPHAKAWGLRTLLARRVAQCTRQWWRQHGVYAGPGGLPADLMAYVESLRGWDGGVLDVTLAGFECGELGWVAGIRVRPRNWCYESFTVLPDGVCPNETCKCRVEAFNDDVMLPEVVCRNYESGERRDRRRQLGRRRPRGGFYHRSPLRHAWRRPWPLVRSPRPSSSWVPPGSTPFHRL